MRLATLEAAGQEAVPFTTGILIGGLGWSVVQRVRVCGQRPGMRGVLGSTHAVN